MTVDPVVFVLDDDHASRESLCALLRARGLTVEGFESATRFLDQADSSREGCIVTDLRMPGMDGLQLLKALENLGNPWPVVMMSAYANVPTAVEAMSTGALTMLEKPIDEAAILNAVQLALSRNREQRKASARLQEIESRVNRLSEEERQVMYRMLAGKPNKAIAQDLQISSRTVDRRRHDIHETMGVATLPELTRMIMERDYLTTWLRGGAPTLAPPQ